MTAEFLKPEPWDKFIDDKARQMGCELDECSCLECLTHMPVQRQPGTPIQSSSPTCLECSSSRPCMCASVSGLKASQDGLKNEAGGECSHRRHGPILVGLREPWKSDDRKPLMDESRLIYPMEGSHLEFGLRCADCGIRLK